MRNIPDDNLAYPVFIQLDSGSTGSGFILNVGEMEFFVTAKHVLVDPDSKKIRGRFAELICQTKELDDDSVTKFQVDLTNSAIIHHTNADVSVIKIAKLTPSDPKGLRGFNPEKGVKLIETGKTDMVHVSAESTKKLRDVLISNDIFLYGYPTSIGLKDLPQFDYKKPLLRKGIIANVNLGLGTIILDCPVYYGNSGGPVVEVNYNWPKIEHKVIGVVSQIIPFTENWVNTRNGLVHTEMSNSGYSVAESMDKVFELISHIQ